MVIIGGEVIDLVMLLAVALVLVCVLYLVALVGLSRRDPEGQQRHAAAAGTDPGFDVVFLIPCLNEERVVGASLDRLLRLPHPRVRVLVVDDGSDDGTAEVVRAVQDPRIHLLQRVLPVARQGKGEALNAAVAHIRNGGIGAVTDPDSTIVVVVDADGRLEEHSLHEVLPGFADPVLGGVQVGVRINNRHSSLLARMQDFEFVLYTEVFQRGRRHLGSVGLGGNGQFVRLSALNSLGPAPWTHSLSEDLDLGVRLLIAGWRLDFCRHTAVHQQGLVDLGPWIRQRTRWFQGHLQSWGLVPQVLNRLGGRRRADLYYHLTSPFLLLVSSLFTLAFLTWVVRLGMDAVAGQLEFSWMWVSSYAFAFGPMVTLALIYRRVEAAEHRMSLLSALGLAHVYVGYATLWYVAGWRAVARTLRGRTGWAKTDRLEEGQQPDATPGLVSAAVGRQS